MNADQIKPLIAESSTSESTPVSGVMDDLRDRVLEIPDYQRDADQWNEVTRSLLIESIINNLTIPAFFFEVVLMDGFEKNSVVDGQQRLTTMFDFYQNKFRLVDSDDAPYLSPHSTHYAGKTFEELPPVYQQAFRKYRLTIIKLRQLGDMRLEIFRRINQGGTPLSGQDIRLAYYGGTHSVTFVRLVGVYDQSRPAARRFIDTAQEKFGISWPWQNPAAMEAWNEWWADKDISHGQTASEMFLWAFMSSQVDRMADLLANTAALQALNVRFNRGVGEALDACCAQLRYQDLHTDVPPLLMPFDELRDKFFPFFEAWFSMLINQKGPSLHVSKNRVIASLIGAFYSEGHLPESLSEEQWTAVVEFVRRPPDIARKFNLEWPVSKGKWDGKKGHRAQLQLARNVVSRLMS